LKRHERRERRGYGNNSTYRNNDRYRDNNDYYGRP
jgi:hypothetical protein